MSTHDAPPQPRHQHSFQTKLLCWQLHYFSVSCKINCPSPRHFLDDNCVNDIVSTIDFYKGQPIQRSPEYGFNQLAEVAIKALSPGINDPATAVISLHALTELLRYHLRQQMPGVLMDTNGVARISRPVQSFNALFEQCIHPVLRYGDKDQYIQNELLWMTEQLSIADERHLYHSTFKNLARQINLQKEKSLS